MNIISEANSLCTRQVDSDGCIQPSTQTEHQRSGLQVKVPSKDNLLNESPSQMLKPSLLFEEHSRDNFYDYLLLTKMVSINHNNDNILFRRCLKSQALSGAANEQAPQRKYLSQCPNVSLVTIASPIPVTKGLSSQLNACRQKLLAYLKERLRNDKTFKVKELEKPIPDHNESNFKSLDRYTGINIQAVSPEQIDLDALCLHSKELSVSFQLFLENQSPQYIANIAQRISLRYKDFLSHKLGNYILQKLIQIDLGTRHLLEEYSRANFGSLIDNEYASRVLELLIKESRSFRLFVINHFKCNFSCCYSTIASGLLLIACLKSCDDFDQFSFILNELQLNPGLLESKIFQRIMVSVVQVSPSYRLERVSALLDFDRNLASYFNDKFTAYLVFTACARKFIPVIELLVKRIAEQFDVLLETRFFKVVLVKLLSLQDEHEAASRVSDAIIGIETWQIVRLSQKRPLLFYYLYICISLVTKEDLQKFNFFINKLKEQLNLAAFLPPNLVHKLSKLPRVGDLQ